VIQLLVFGYAVNTDVRNAPTILVDQDNTPTSRALADALTASGNFAIKQRSSRSGDIDRVLDDGSALAGVLVSPGFERGPWLPGVARGAASPASSGTATAAPDHSAVRHRTVRAGSGQDRRLPPRSYNPDLRASLTFRRRRRHHPAHAFCSRRHGRGTNCALLSSSWKATQPRS
jgi:hypothetical protein